MTAATIAMQKKAAVFHGWADLSRLVRRRPLDFWSPPKGDFLLGQGET